MENQPQFDIDITPCVIERGPWSSRTCRHRGTFRSRKFSRSFRCRRGSSVRPDRDAQNDATPDTSFRSRSEPRCRTADATSNQT